MNAIQVLSYTIAPYVLLRRAVVGPRRTTWNTQTEVIAEVMRRSANPSAFLPLSLQRKSLEPPAGLVTSAMKRTKRTSVVANGVPCEWIEPESFDPSRVVVYLHGGGYVACSLNSHRDLMCRLAIDSGMRVLGVDYRLAPEHPYPAQLEDSIRVFEWLTTVEGIAPERIVLAGESAGAGLALSTLVALRDSGSALPAGAVLISGWFNVNTSAKSMKTNKKYDYIQRYVLSRYAKRFTVPRRFREPLASPLFAEFKSLPPLFLQVGDCETLRDDSITLAEKARAAGVDVILEVWPDMIHAFPVLAHYVPDGKRAIVNAAQFARQRTA